MRWILLGFLAGCLSAQDSQPTSKPTDQRTVEQLQREANLLKAKLNKLYAVANLKREIARLKKELEEALKTPTEKAVDAKAQLKRERIKKAAAERGKKALDRRRDKLVKEKNALHLSNHWADDAIAAAERYIRSERRRREEARRRGGIAIGPSHVSERKLEIKQLRAKIERNIKRIDAINLELAKMPLSEKQKR